MSQPCAATKCERVSRAPCDCCQQHLCLQHLNEHNALVLAQLNPLTDEINALGDRLNTFNIQGTTNDSRQKLEQWCNDCHRTIDRFFKQKCEELDRFIAAEVDQQREKLVHIQTKLDKLIRQQEATRQDIDVLTTTVRQLEKGMKKIEQTCFQIDMRSLLIDDSMVQIKNTYIHELGSTTFSFVYKKLEYSEGSHKTLASNDRLLLIHQHPNLCLIDREMNLVKQIIWPHGRIRDMCWSSKLAAFILIEENNVYLVDESTMSIVNVAIAGQRIWFACTCSDTSLFLSTRSWGSSIVKLSLLPSVVVVNEWKFPVTCTASECIKDICYNNGTLALLINNRLGKSMRMELRSVEKLNRIWLLSLDIVYNLDKAFRCCSLHSDEWFAIDFVARRLLYISNDGKLKGTVPYNAEPYRACRFGSEMLALVTVNEINFHKI